jgi:hypothetical protein
MSDYFFPKLMAVEALAPYRLRTSWSTGEVLELDLESKLRKGPALAPLLDPAVFARVHKGGTASSGLMKSLVPTMFTLGPKRPAARSATRCLISG